MSLLLVRPGQLGLVVKVKEPLASEYGYLRDDLLLFTYLHMAATPELADARLVAKTTGIAYETVRDSQVSYHSSYLSGVPGRMAVQIGLTSLLSKLVAPGVHGGVPGYLKESNHHGWRCRRDPCRPHQL